ncbi:hypothetical protein ACFYO0_37010 [Streptomyces sp. NPDC006365]|uniref:hypothetical protein n=1 Tax=Streptomyces sp. NPDC006365 TaxID=3364744 RepID=UPI0036896F6C
MRRRRARLPLEDARSELAEIRARLVGLLQDTVGPALTAEQGQELLERAKAWSPPMARELHAHMAQFPDALTDPSPHCPSSLPRLLQVLEAAGHDGAVTSSPA